MIFTLNQTVKDRVTMMISAEPGIKTAMLSKKLENEGRQITRPGLYKILNQLHEEEVLLKVATRWYINIRWLAAVGRWSSLAETIQAPYLLDSGLLPQKRRERREFTFANALDMDAFWGNLLIALTNQADTALTIYAYNPHFWFYLAHGIAEQQYADTVAAKQVETKMLIGSKSVLDQWNANLGVAKTTWHFYPVPLFSNTPHQAFNSIGDYFLTISYDPTMAKKLHELFETTDSIESLDHQKLNCLLSYYPTSITVAKNPAKQYSFEKKLRKIFDKAM